MAEKDLPIKVTVKWHFVEGEPSPLWSRLWDKLLAQRIKKEANTHRESRQMNEKHTFKT